MHAEMKRAALVVTLCMLVGVPCLVADSYPAMGMVLGVDRARRTVEVSCRAIPGHSEAKIMTIPVREVAELDGIRRGMLIDFVLAVSGGATYAETVHIHV